MFEGTVSIVDGGRGRGIEVRFLGDAAARHVTEAQAYLDAARPGWAAETGVTLQAGARSVAGGPRSAAAAAALEHATPRARRLAARLAPLYENWTGRSAAERRDLLVGIVNEQLRAAGMPEVKAAFGSGGAGERGRFVPSLWELHLSAELLGGHSQTPEQFAKACETAIHEGHHAMQTFRAATDQSRDGREASGEGGFQGRDGCEPAGVEGREGQAVCARVGRGGECPGEHVGQRPDPPEGGLRPDGRRGCAPREDAGSVPHVQEDAPGIAGEAEGDPRCARGHAEARDAAHDDYMRLPEEVEAWKIGLETRAAVAERIKLDAQIAKARRDVEAAHEAFSKIDGPLLEQLADPVNPPTAQAQLAWERALNLERMKRNILRSFIERRTRLVLGTT